MTTSMCSCACRRDGRATSSFRHLLYAAAAPASSRRRAAWLFSALLLALVCGTTADATRCAPRSTFSCCTKAVCSRATDASTAKNAPCCDFLLGLEANDEAMCAALGELFMNDWGTNVPCLAGWFGNFGPADYANSDINGDLAASIADYANVTTTTEYDGSKTVHAYNWGDTDGNGGPNLETVPSGWAAAAVGIHTDYCTFHGVGCDDQGRVITLCAPISARV